MDVSEVKAVIKSLIASSPVPYTISGLIVDFEKEVGRQFPIYNYRNAYSFLKSLSDIGIRGKPPYQEVYLIGKTKSQHITSLVKRQRKYGRPKDVYHNVDLKDFQCENYVKPVKYINKSDRVQKKEVANITEEAKKEKSSVTIKESVVQEKNKSNSGNVDYLFREDEITNLCIDPKLLQVVKPSSHSRITSSKTGSVSSVLSCYDDSDNSHSHINDGIKAKLKILMEKQTHGIWCCDLPDLYYQNFKVPLEFEENGYRNLIDMVMELNEIFRYVRPDNGDWLLFDASKPLTEEEKELHRALQNKIPKSIEKNIMQLIETHCENSFHGGICLDELLVLYFKKFRAKLDFTRYGFSNIHSFISKLDGHILRLKQAGKRILICPLVDHPAPKNSEDGSFLQISPDDDLFKELFPDDVVQLGEEYPTIDIKKCFPTGKKTPINVAEVLSPSLFYVQLRRHEDDLSDLMENLQLFYLHNMEKYKMPDATIRPKQVCAALYKGVDDPWSWYRSVINKVKKNNKVIVNLIDYGTKISVEKSELRFLHRKFFALPAQSVAAALKDLKPVVGESWPLVACRKFLDFVSGPVEFLVTEVDSEYPKITGDLFSACDSNKRQSLSDVLLKDKLSVVNSEDKVEATALSTVSVSTAGENGKLDALVGDGPGSEGLWCMTTTRAVPEKIIENGHSSNCSQNEEDKKSGKNLYEISKINKPCLDDNCDLRSKDGELVNATEKSGSWTVQKEVYAAAFTYLLKNSNVRKVAEKNFEKGLRLAVDLATSLVASGNVMSSHCS